MPSPIGSTVTRRAAAESIRVVLDGPEVGGLVQELEAARRETGGRRGYGSRALIGTALVRGWFGLATWTAACDVVAGNSDLQKAIGGSPSLHALYRFDKKLRSREGTRFAACFRRVLASLHEIYPEMGRNVAVDATDVPTWAVGHKFVRKGGPERKRRTDPEAGWGHRSATGVLPSGSFYGYGLDTLVCTRTGLPIAWNVRNAVENESTFVARLLDGARARGFTPETLAADKAYDGQPVHTECENRDCHPIIPLRETATVERGDHEPPLCVHGTWVFGGADYRRKETKWRCPTGECPPPRHIWRKFSRLHPAIPYGSRRWKSLYGGRNAAEGLFSLLKLHYGLRRPPVRGRDRMAHYIDVLMLARLCAALALARAGPSSA